VLRPPVYTHRGPFYLEGQFLFFEGVFGNDGSNNDFDNYVFDD
jgi:hypothetical protein